FAVSAELKGRPPKSTARDACTGETSCKDRPAKLRSSEPSDAHVLPYAGLCHDRSTIEAAIARNNLSYQWYDDDLLAEEIAARIESGQTVGLLRGRSEIGPRAL